MKLQNPFYWMGISFIVTGIFLSFILPLILHHYPNSKHWVKPAMLWYHIFGILFGIYITWFIYVSEF